MRVYQRAQLMSNDTAMAMGREAADSHLQWVKEERKGGKREAGSS